MNEPHQIRIRGPWNYSTSEGETGVVKLPGIWEQRDVGLNLNRKFNWIAELEESETVFLMFNGYGGCGPVAVNDERIGELDGSLAAFEITHLLQPTNIMNVELSFEALASETPAGLWGEVHLEVRSS